MSLAYELGKTESEIMAMTPEEFGRWEAFFRIRNKKLKTAQSNRSSAPKSTAGRGGRRRGN